MKRVTIVAMLLLVTAWCLTGDAFASKPTAEPGKQLVTARYAKAAPVLDGAIGPGEYSAAIPTHGNFVKPATAPGVVQWWDTNPQNPDDLSYTIYAVYDATYLYVAVDVADDNVIHDFCCGGYTTWTSPDSWEVPTKWYCTRVPESYFGTVPYYDDDVEIFVDGDNVGNDISMLAGIPGSVGGGPEGFQVLSDYNGDRMTNAWVGPPIQWDAAPGRRPRGYVVEFRIELASIDMIDGEGSRAPEPGDAIGFNVVAGDDDNGSLPYNWGQELCDCPFTEITCDTPGWDDCPDPYYQPEWGFVTPDEVLTDSFGMWDGLHAQPPPGVGNVTFMEDYWGSLYLEPPAKGKSRKPVAGGAEPTTWGEIKGQGR